MNFKLDAVVEIPKGSNVKYEIEKGKLLIDRLLFGDFVYPINYGFIPDTLDYDGDPLDVLIIANAKLLPCSMVKVRILGAMKMIDEGETDTKLIGVVDTDPNSFDIKKLDDIKKGRLEEIEHFFSNYKKYKNSIIKIDGFAGFEYSQKVYNETKELFKKYRDYGKDKFIEEMKKIHPEKYDK